MKTLVFQSVLFLHVIAGVIALVTGLVAMFAPKKGGKLHNVTGLMFYYSMAFVFVSSVIFFILEPSSLKYQFFLAIGVVSFYPIYTGRSVLYMKKQINTGLFHKSLAVLAVLTGIGMLVYGNLGAAPSQYQILFNVFGVILILNGLGDVRVYFGLKPTAKNYWLMAHIGKMLGGYSAALTAFMVNVVPRYLPAHTSMFVFIAMWTLPAIVLTFYAAFVRKKYSPKVKASPRVKKLELEIA
ncbi:hypothetical protein SAMN06298216_2476 [Spirosomataceae bacterium TFI 002]|nr:hypothetical protein SAMN06298216_2476 [Spirosomataceae bacterium TFI 002]